MTSLKYFKFVLLLTLSILVITSSGVFLSGCGSSEGATKDEKSKKKKKKKVYDESEDETADEESGDNDLEKSEKKSEESSDSGKSEDKKAPVKSEEAEKIWKDLMKGNERFVAGKHSVIDYAAARRALTKAQKPEAIILGCADSRVPPELVFDKNLGELFVVRAAGNVADPISLGSIEYAVEHLKSKLIVVLGHENCGAVGAALTGEEMPTRNLNAIVNKIGPALEGSSSCPLGGEMKVACVELNIDQSAKDILKNSPIIKEAIEKGELTIVRAVYMLETGKVLRRD